MCASCWAVTAASVMGDRLNILIESARQRQSLILAPPAPRRVLHELRGALLLRRPPHQLRALVRRRVAALIVTEDDSVR